ncbi:MAG: VCBS repeat-containing protein [Acidobacteriota bacterium]
MAVSRSLTIRLSVLLAMLPFSLAVSAQKPAPTPSSAGEKAVPAETRAQLMDRLGLTEDPGPDPDQSHIYLRYGQPWIIAKFEKRWAVFDDPRPGWVRPFGPANFAKEIYQMNENWIWVFVEAPKKTEAPAPSPKPSAPVVTANPNGVDQVDAKNEQFDEHSAESIQYFESMRPEFAVLDVPASGKTISFEDSSAGLPTTGSFRNSGDVADMNGDGCPDIISPPQRGAGGSPSIFLGDCKGGWTHWPVKFPKGFNYGGAVAGDFNKDGHMDLAFAVHLSGVEVFLGDGKGNFTDHSEGLPERFPTRRIIARDVNRDGWLDLVAISEGPTMNQQAEETPHTRLKVLLNEKGRTWKDVNVADRYRLLAGDWLTSADLNGDKYPDFVGASIFYNGPDILFLSKGAGKWEPTGRGTLIPFLSYYWANTAGRFTGKKTDDVIIGYSRYWPANLDPQIVARPENRQVVGLDMLTWSKGAVKRVPITRWATNSPIWGMASADFDGDGNLDVAYTLFQPRQLVILLGDGKGGFRKADLKGAELRPNTSYDLKAADVNKDGRPDLVILYETRDSKIVTREKDGSIQVLLNGGAAKTGMEDGAKTGQALPK